MSVESEILRIQHNIADAYTKVAEKGGEVPLQPNSANLAASIETIAGGGSDLTAGDGVSIQDGEVSVATPVRSIVTQAEFDALPEAERNKGLYVISDGGSGGSGESAGEVYSTEETRIGTWIDGKPLYRKTFETSHSSVSNHTWTDCGSIQDMAYGMIVNGCIRGGAPSDRFLDLQSSIFRLAINADGLLQFYPENYSATYGATSWVTAEYTKTTDEGGIT